MRKGLLLFLLTLLLMPASLWAQQGAPGHGYYAQAPRFRMLILYEPTAEEAHVQFDHQAIRFFRDLTVGDGFHIDVATSMDQLKDSLARYSVVMMLNYMPSAPDERKAFEEYMEHGGGWIGFHAAGYNDRNTHWPWFNQFLGCGTFLCNNWPPTPALVECDTQESPVTRNLLKEYVAPASEFYMWNENPRQNPDVEVLQTVSPKNYPLGLKDIITSGDFPIVWTNHRYRMVYLNMGHGDQAFIDATQNLLFVNALRYVVSLDKNDPFAEGK